MNGKNLSIYPFSYKEIFLFYPVPVILKLHWHDNSRRFDIAGEGAQGRRLYMPSHRVETPPSFQLLTVSGILLTRTFGSAAIFANTRPRRQSTQSSIHSDTYTHSHSQFSIHNSRVCIQYTHRLNSTQSRRRLANQTSEHDVRTQPNEVRQFITTVFRRGRRFGFFWLKLILWPKLDFLADTGRNRERIFGLSLISSHPYKEIVNN